MLRYGSEKGDHLMRSIMKHLVAWAALGGVIAGIIPASAAGYPDRAVKVIVPFAAGGPTDVMARLISQKLSENLKQQFYVEDHAGAGGNIGMTIAARSAPDGYTILVASSSFMVNPSLYDRHISTRRGARCRRIRMDEGTSRASAFAWLSPLALSMLDKRL